MCEKLGIKGFKNLMPNKLVGDLILFIENHLPEFISSPEFVEMTEIKKNENQHSKAFCTYMTNRCKSTFYFCREAAQKGTSTVDIGVSVGSKQIFTIEAKILPTPLTGLRAEHEYVYGQGGGIERFKKGLHGLDDWDNFLPENGIIAYIKESDFEFWLNKVNQWILDATWSESEKLKVVYLDRAGKLVSEHIRNNKSSLTLHHFWVKHNG